jgi:hypothetical protein
MDYYIDSFRTSCPTGFFRNIYIPEQMLIADGEVLDTFKNRALKVDYKNTTIYVGVKVWNLKNSHGSNLIILYSAKAAKTYNTGIKLQTHLDVLAHLKNLNIVDYNPERLDEIVRNTYVKDLDIKTDKTYFVLTGIEAEHSKIVEEITSELLYLKRQYDLKHDSTPLNRGAKLYNHKKGFMLQLNRRPGSTHSNPFYKIYNKSLEMRTKEQDFLKKLPLLMQEYYTQNLVIRSEFTIREKSDFQHYEIINFLPEILKVTDEKWHEIHTEIRANLFETQEFESIKRLNLSPLDAYIVNLMKHVYRTDKRKNKNNDVYVFNYQLFIDLMPEVSSATAKTRLKQKIEKLYFNYVNN